MGGNVILNKNDLKYISHLYELAEWGYDSMADDFEDGEEKTFEEAMDWLQGIYVRLRQ